MSFNVITDKWVTVRYLDNHIDTISIRDSIKDAHLICEVVDTNPIYTYGIYMLMFIITMDTLRIQNKYEKEEILEKNQFDISVFDKYFYETCDINRFNIFNEDYPFLQWYENEFLDKDKTVVSDITIDKVHGTNIMHNDRTLSEKFINLSYEECAKAVCSWRIFAPGVGKRNYASLFSDAIYHMIDAENLYKKICKNIVYDKTVLGDIDNLPAPWRAPDNTMSSTNYSLFSYIYSPNSKIRLIDNGHFVTQVYKCSNPEFKEKRDDLRKLISQRASRNPYITYKENKKDSILTKVCYKDFRTISDWNDYLAFFPTGDTFESPKILESCDFESSDIELISFYADCECEADCKHLGMISYTFPKELYENHAYKFEQAFKIVEKASKWIHTVENGVIPRVKVNGKWKVLPRFENKNLRPKCKNFGSRCKEAFNTEFLFTFDLDTFQETVNKIAYKCLIEMYEEYRNDIDFKLFVKAINNQITTGDK